MEKEKNKQAAKRVKKNKSKAKVNRVQFSLKELKQWIEEGFIPEQAGEFALTEFKNIFEDVSTLNDLRGGLEGQDLKSWFEKNGKSLKDIKKTTQLIKSILEHKEDLKTIVNALGKRPQRFRQSGHLVDQKLKYKINNKEIHVQGISLTQAEDRMVNTLNKILHKKSEVKNIKSNLFYLGNKPAAEIDYGIDEKKNILKSPAAIIQFTPHELYCEYAGNKNYSGAEASFAREILEQLADKKFLITYNRHRHEGVGKSKRTVIDKILGFQNLIQILRCYSSLTRTESIEVDKGSSKNENKEEIIVALNPIFTDQIDTKYIEYPEDINKRMLIAAGGGNRITQSMNCLRDCFLRVLSNKQKTWIVCERKLFQTLKLGKYLKQGRKKLLNKRVETAVQTMFNLGILLKWERKIERPGEAKYIFHLNKDYDRKR